MVSIFITAFAAGLAILFIVGIGLYFWQKSAPDTSERILPPSPDFYGLFAEESSGSKDATAQSIAQRELTSLSLIDRARKGDRAALSEAKDRTVLYDRVLNELVAHADSDAVLLSLMSYVAQHELKANTALAKAVVASWKTAPDRSTTAKALHFAALSDDADLFGETVEQALQFWREKTLDIAPQELQALFRGEFWILSARTRSSGAGFVLKRTLDSAHRELEATGSESPSASKDNSPNEALPDGRASDT